MEILWKEWRIVTSFLLRTIYHAVAKNLYILGTDRTEAPVNPGVMMENHGGIA